MNSWVAMKRAGIFLLWIAGCAPFSVISRSIAVGGLSMTPCGVSAATVASVIQAMDNLGAVQDGALPPEQELTVCLVAENAAGKPVRIDRSHVHLKCPHEREAWVPDRDPEVVTVPPG